MAGSPSRLTASGRGAGASRRGVLSGLCVESACAKCITFLVRVPVGQERPAGSSRSITERNDFSLMTGHILPADGHETGPAQAAISFPPSVTGSASRPKSELVEVFSITTRTISPI
ncbi:hypothetical protein D3C87_1875590 [compost metagenome]